MLNQKISLTRLLTLTLIVLVLFILAYFKEVGTFITTGKVENHLSLIQIIRPSLGIPRLRLEASVLPFGLTKDGALDTPKLPQILGWYSQSAIPGEIGTAVISGHYGWKDGLQASFDNLNKLVIGDKIYFTNIKGEVSTFLVQAIKVYGKDDNTPQTFIANDNLAHLNLITCTGTWNVAEKTYSERLVIFTDKI